MFYGNSPDLSVDDTEQNADTVDLLNISFLLPDQYTLSELALALDAVRLVNTMDGSDKFSWSLHSPDGSAVNSSVGMTTSSLKGGAVENSFMVIIVGSSDLVESNEIALAGIINRAARHGARICALSNGVFPLARSGLLDRKQCVVASRHRDSFIERFPDIDMVESLYLTDGPITTCVGGTATLDIMARQFRDIDHQLYASEIVAHFAIDRIRNEHDIPPWNWRAATRGRSRELCEAIKVMEQNLEVPVSLDDIATEIDLSRRQLERLFRKLDTTPNVFYRNLRLLRANRLLSGTTLSVTEISNACGFSSSSHFSQCFKSRYSVSPVQTRSVSGL